MEPISLSKIIEATGGTLLSGTPDVEIFGISTDTRTIHKGDLFVALEGERFDGHYFIDEAFKKGAIGAIVSREVESKNIIIKVRDTLKTLGDIAKIYREEFDIPVIAVTGSNGKTTTKEMLGYILTREFKTVKAKGSYNNFVGVPLTLLEMDRHTQLAVLEMETNLLGGIKRLCEIAKPSVGVVTNIGDTHLQFLKTREGVYQEKSELVESLPEDGVAVLNADDPYVLKMNEISRTKRIVTFGVENKSEFSASNIRVGDTFLEFTLNNNYRVKLNTISYCNVYNGLAAIAVSHVVFGLSLEKVIDILKDFKFPSLRMELIEIPLIDRATSNEESVRIINDCYNANPQSMQEALVAVGKMNSYTNKIAILGEMLELGEKAPEFHYQIGKICADCGFDMLITVGDLAQYMAHGAEDEGMPRENIFVSVNNVEASDRLLRILRPGDIVLIKGSRGMKMEEIVERLRKRLGVF